MAVYLAVSVTLNGGSIDATVFEDTDQDGTAEAQETLTLSRGSDTYTFSTLTGSTGNDYWVKFDLDNAGLETTPVVDSATLDTKLSAELTADVTLNGGTIDATVFEDTDQDGTAENQKTVSLSGGTNTYPLPSLDGDAGSDVWVKFDLDNSGITSTPEVNSVTYDTLAEPIAAQAATVQISGQNPSVQAGAVSIQPDVGVITLAPQDGAVSPGAVSVGAQAASLDLQAQNGAVAAGEAVISAPEATLQITAQNAGRVFDSTTLSGTVTLDGSAVEGATIYCIDDTNESIAEVTSTDANGDYRVRVDTGDLYHMVVQYEDGQGNQYNDESKPFLAT
jgi:hypothetical protein